MAGVTGEAAAIDQPTAAATKEWDRGGAGRPPRRFRDVAAAPPGLAFNLVVAATLTVMLLCTATPGWVVIPLLGLAFVLSVLGTIWLARAVLFLVVRPTDPPHGTWRGLVVAPVLVVVAGGLVALDVPVRVGFAVSRADLQAAADRVLASPVPDPSSADSAAHVDVRGRHGVYDIIGSRRFPNGVVLFESNGSFFDDAGFAYLPDGNLPIGDGSFESPDFRALGGGWYAFTSSW